ncbi:MAG: ATP-dependent DNA helicase RecG [Acidobacteria bacterium]|nr:MAG: ATP-dependent DNA helicase RecG [Acidobacteriota bacterium]
MVTVADVSIEQRDLILALPEGHFHDLKSRDIAPGKLTKTIAGFANAAGGELYVGIDERTGPGGAKIRSWRGFADPEEANGHLQAFEQVSPLGTYVRATFLRSATDSGLVLQLEVLKTREIVKATDGIAYVRRGAQNLPQMLEDQLARLRLDKGITSFESETVSTDPVVVTNSTVALEFLLNVVPTAEPEQWLRKQLLLSGDKPTVAAVLLFSELPQAILPKRCGIKLLRYRTTDTVGARDTLAFDPITIEGWLYEQIAAAVRETVRVVEGVQVMGPMGLESIKYPNETLHEIITNAVLHRDYSIAADIQIRVFDNRIEIESPGRLPGHITTQNILTEQFARNGVIVRLINKFPDPPNKDVGEGLNTAFQAMRALRLKDPVIEDRDSSVVVHIRHERLASPEEAILTYLKKNDEINNAVARQITGITSENKVKEVFYRLRDAGKLERVPGRLGSASAWRRPARNGNKNGTAKNGG